MTHLHPEKIIPASLEVLSGNRRVDNNKVSDQLISLWENIALSKFRESLQEEKAIF